MKHARAEYHGHHEEECDSRIKGIVNDSEHVGLAESADESEDISDEVELPQLRIVSRHFKVKCKTYFGREW